MASDSFKKERTGIAHGTASGIGSLHFAVIKSFGLAACHLWSFALGGIRANLPSSGDMMSHYK